MSKYILNDSGSTKSYKSVPVLDGVPFEVPLARYAAFASCEDLVTDVGSGVVAMSKDGTTALSVAEGLELLVTVYPVSKELTVVASPPFSAKTVDGKGLFSRFTGKKFPLGVGDTDCVHTVTFNLMKFNGVEIVGAAVGDKVDLFVLDDGQGTYSGTANATLNQFGYSVYPAADFYQHKSNYDADLYVGMQIKAVINTDTAKDIYINYDLHELK